MVRDTLLNYPDFNENFNIHTNASAFQVGGVINQKVEPIDFYSIKLTGAQQRYTVTERELLSIVETLKDFRKIVLGQKLQMYTDHKNLMCIFFNTDRVLIWRLILEEYGKDIEYNKDEKNMVADGLSIVSILILIEY